MTVPSNTGGTEIISAWLKMLAGEGHEPPNEHCIEFRDGRVIVDGVLNAQSWREVRPLLIEEPA